MKSLGIIFILLSIIGCQPQEEEFFIKDSLTDSIQKDNLEEYEEGFEESPSIQNNEDQFTGTDETHMTDEDSVKLIGAEAVAAEAVDVAEIFADEAIAAAEIATADNASDESVAAANAAIIAAENADAEATAAENAAAEAAAENAAAEAEGFVDTEYYGSNIVTNGSFEEGHGLGNNQWSLYESLPGWKVDRDLSDAPIEIQNGKNIGGMTPTDGTAKLEIDSHSKNGFSESDAVVYQEVETEIGKIYKLSFDYTPRTANKKESNAVDIYFDGQLIASLQEDKREWLNYTFKLEGSGVESRLEFRARKDQDTLGGFIDNVSLKEISFLPFE